MPVTVLSAVFRGRNCQVGVQYGERVPGLRSVVERYLCVERPVVAVVC